MRAQTLRHRCRRLHFAFLHLLLITSVALLLQQPAIVATQAHLFDVPEGENLKAESAGALSALHSADRPVLCRNNGSCECIPQRTMTSALT